MVKEKYKTNIQSHIIKFEIRLQNITLFFHINVLLNLTLCFIFVGGKRIQHFRHRATQLETLDGIKNTISWKRSMLSIRSTTIFIWSIMFLLF